MNAVRKVRTFDAFPKAPPEHTVRSTRGGSSTILTLIFLLFLVWVEIGGYIDGFVDHQFLADNERLHRDLKINLDLVVAMPCNYIHTNVRDATSDKFLAAEKLVYEGVGFQIPHWFITNGQSPVYTAELDEIVHKGYQAEFVQTEQRELQEGAPACHIFGSIPVNQVKGDLHITAKGYGYRDRKAPPREALNFTHVINELSFGQFFPLLNNPLDESAHTTDENLHTYIYELKVVPTLYKKLGAEIDTYQFSAQAFDKSAVKQVPGIFFRYDFEPIKMVIEEKRLTFVQFVLRLVTILGGLMVVISWIYQFSDKLLVKVLGRRATRGEEKPLGLLDT